MNTKQINCIINCDPVMRRTILGVYAANTFPEHVPFLPFGFVVNSQNNNQNGQHWLCIFITSNQSGLYGYFIDSFALQPSFYSKAFRDFFVNNGIKLICNTKRLQSDNSLVCGEYCCFFLSNLSRGLSMEDVVNLFGNNYVYNDIFVYDYIRMSFPACL